MSFFHHVAFKPLKNVIILVNKRWYHYEKPKKKKGETEEVIARRRGMTWKRKEEIFLL